MSKTKIAGYLMIAIALINTAVDALNGGAFNIGGHFNDLYIAANGAGLIFLRDAIKKIGAVVGIGDAIAPTEENK